MVDVVPGVRDAHAVFRAGPDRSGVDDVVLVVGNCQAESLRVLLDAGDGRAVRVPPVFELTAAEVPVLEAWLRRASALVVQPIHDDYRGLPVGTAQLRAHLPSWAGVSVVPILRFGGLHPYQVTHHHGGGAPPVPCVAYHDLRTVARALGLSGDVGYPGRTAARPEQVRAVARRSVEELRRREQRTDVVGSDLLERPEAGHWRTLNHPGNPVLLALAARVAAGLGLPTPRDPGRDLLASVRAPLEAAVAEAWGLPVSAVDERWWVDGRPLDDEVVVDRQLRWYAEHPHLARAVWERHRDQARVMGLTT